MKKNITCLILGIVIRIVLSIGGYTLYPLLPSIDLTAYQPDLETINTYCERYTTKNILELGIILLMVILMTVFILRERKKT